jgi:hypothetical protein
VPVDGSSPRILDGEEWQSYFRDVKRSAFRLEVHQTYTMPAEAETVRAFLAGESMPERFNASWHELIRGHAAAGRGFTRAKIVRKPLTDYSRYLFEWCIPGNVAAGEDYQIVDLVDGGGPGLPQQDFWLFDETTVVRLNYRADGTHINRELIQDADIGTYLAWRDLALESAVPFSVYRA